MKKILFYISLFIISWVYSIRFLDVDFDLYSRLAVGKIFFGLGQILKVDPFAFTHTKNLWIDHEWGSSVVFWFFASKFGDAGLILLKIVVFFLCILFIHKTVKIKAKENSFNILYYLLLILALFNGFASNVRCQIFTFLFFSIWVYALEKIRWNTNFVCHCERLTGTWQSQYQPQPKFKNYIWFFPLIMLFWANMHGGFVTGLGLL
ncbi:MAG: hypothetical protein WC197_08260, partial [Candidatus Gastranaerophilaceae bacterium]